MKYLIIILLLCPTVVSAHQLCNCPCDTASVRNSYIPDYSDGIDTLRLLFHVVCTNDSTECAPTQSNIPDMVDSVNQLYDSVRVFFDYSVNVIRSDGIYEQDWGEFSENLIDGLRPHFVENDKQINIFRLNSSISYGILPWDTTSDGEPRIKSKENGVLWLSANAWSTAGARNLAHELGHIFGLLHPFENQTDSCTSDQRDYIGADSAHSDTTGDWCSDTYWDMGYYGSGGEDDCFCEGDDSLIVDPCYSGTDSCYCDTTGAAWKNIMGYSGHAYLFTPQQRGRMQWFIENQLSSFKGLVP